MSIVLSVVKPHQSSVPGMCPTDISYCSVDHCHLPSHPQECLLLNITPGVSPYVPPWWSVNKFSLTVPDFPWHYFSPLWHSLNFLRQYFSPEWCGLRSLRFVPLLDSWWISSLDGISFLHGTTSCPLDGASILFGLVASSSRWYPSLNCTIPTPWCYGKSSSQAVSPHPTCSSVPQQVCYAYTASVCSHQLMHSWHT